MQQILKFFIHNRVGILFLVLFSLSIGLTVQSHSYHNNKWVSSTNFISTYFFETKHDITSYFNLKDENNKLLLQNKLLLNQLSHSSGREQSNSKEEPLYNFINAQIISNSYDKIDNFVLIDVGRADGVQEGYGVSLPNGILGIVEKSTENYSRVISILNTNLSINAKLKDSNQFGSLIWDAQSLDEMQLEDLPRSAKFSVGDTILTGNNSLIFPKNIPIGTIKNFDLNNSSGYYNIRVKLFADMTNLNHAYVILPVHIEEALKLLDQDE